jgi:hypothetical protein
MEFYRPEFEQFLRYGIRIGVNQLGVNMRRRLGRSGGGCRWRYWRRWRGNKWRCKNLVPFVFLV